MEGIPIVIEKLVWDEWNVGHIARHQVTTDEVETSLKDENVVFLKAKQGRVMALGRAGRRLIASVLNEQETRRSFYVVTARDMSRKERAFYRARKEGYDERQ